MQVPETRYARAGGIGLAYQKYGDGPPLLIIPPLVSHIEVSWEHELYRRVFEHYAKHMTVVQFDKRGIGLSDRPDEPPGVEQRIADISLVLDAAGWERASLLGLSEGGAMAQLFAAQYPDRVDRVVLVNSMLSPRYWERALTYARPADPPTRPIEEVIARFGDLVAGWPENSEFFARWFMPSQADNDGFVKWLARVQRLAASPKDFARQVESVVNLDPGDAPERLTQPTLVMQVSGDGVIPVYWGRLLAELVPGARYEELAGADHFLWVMPEWRSICDEIIEFATGTMPASTTTRRLAAVLFTDIVDSTRRSAAVGNDAWRDVLDSHERIARKLIAEHRGRVVKSTGDGFLAVFDMPSQAVECGRALCSSLRAVDVPIRAGIHAGEIEDHESGDISGVAVNLAARVEQTAADGELWVSSTVRDLMLGGSVRFEDRGAHALKGIEGEWRLYAVSP